MDIKQWIIQTLPTNSVVIEAGTCEGLDTEFFSDYFVDGQIYGFEPIPQLYDKCFDRIKDRKNVKLYNMALSDKSTQIKMYVSDRFGETWGSSSILDPKLHLNVHPEIKFNETIEVEGINLDEFCNTQNISKVDFMWLDLQGCEPIIIKSSPNIIANTKYLYSEVSLIENYSNCVLYPEYKKMLNEIGFEVVFEEIFWSDGGNVFFINNNI